MTRWLVTGAGGMLGQDLVALLAAGDEPVTAADRARLDVTDPDAVLDAVAGHDVVVNAAAFTAVDDAEAREPDAFAVNAIGAATVARACARHGARMVHVSTDYVFAGDADRPYPEDAAPAPRAAYGRTKAAGEWAVRAELPGRHWLVRTAWLYGAGGPNFVRTMVALAGSRPHVDVVTDQIGQPTWSRDVAGRIIALVRADAAPGTYHATSTGQVSWFDFTREIFRLIGDDPARVRPTTAAAFGRPAPRPAWSVLGHDAWTAAGLEPIRPWQDALAEALAVTDLGRAALPR